MCLTGAVNVSENCNKLHICGFHLHLLVFPFVYNFHFRIKVLDCLSFANDQFRRISASFQNLFVVIRSCDSYMKKNVAFTLISFAVLNEVIVYQFKCHLSYQFRYRFSELTTV